MPARTLASNVPISGPITSPSFRINGPRAEATCTVTMTAPASTAALIEGVIETSPTNAAPWEIEQQFSIGGGPAKGGGPNHPAIAQGLAQYDGDYIRMRVTSVSGSWTVDSVILDW